MGNPNLPAVSMEHQIGNISQLLAMHESGDLNHEISELQHEMIAKLNQHVMDNGGKPSGSITITLNYKLDSGLMEITANVGSKMPKRIRAKGVYFCTADNKLSKRDPRQIELPLRDVNAPLNTQTRQA